MSGKNDLYAKSLHEFLAEAGSASPTPGGGSVSAVTAANAAAMVSMVANLTIGKKRYAEVQETALEIARGAGAAVESLKELTARDMEVFERFMSAWRMPSETDEQKKEKARAMEDAAYEASMVPLEVCGVCVEILEMARRLAPVGNRSAVSDVGVAAYIADAALRAAMLSVDINLPSIHDETKLGELENRRARLLARAEELKILTVAAVKERLG